MRLKSTCFLTFLALIMMQFSFAQERMISGVVSDNSGPIPGANVTVKGTKNSTQTDFDGKYVVKAKTGDVLVFSYMGMQNALATVGSSSSINAKLKEDGKELDEVVVVAYGKAKKSSYTGSATQIKSEQLENRPLTNALSVLEGSTSGVQVQSSAGQPGSAPEIRIRGFSSVNGSNTPLYVVDGVPFAGDISNINSNDIESLTVLKDASSTSLYGSKAANGVIIITTKAGKSNKDKFSLNVSTGMTSRSIKDYKRVDAYQYYPLEWEAIRNSRPIANQTQIDAANAYASTRVPVVLVTNPFNVPNNSIVGTDGKLNPNAQLLYPDDLDWEKQLEQAGVRQNVDFSYQGKSEKSNYFASLGHLNEEGYIRNTGFERTTGRLNLNTSLNNWFRTGINMSGTLTNSKLGTDGVANTNSFNNPFRTTRYMGPIYPVFDHTENGDYVLDDNGEKVYSTLRGSGASSGRNIVYETLNNTDVKKGLALSGRTFFEISFLKDFKFTTNASIDKTYSNRTYSYNTLIGDGSPTGLMAKEDRIFTGVTYNQLLNYLKKIGNHSVTALLGHESFDYERNWTTGVKTGQVAPDNIEFINYATVTTLESITRNYSTESYFSRVGYDYMDKYIFSASLRRDSSSKFAKDNQWGNFWSFSGAWVVSKENFLSDVSWVNDLKLRASMGQVGNDSHIASDRDEDGTITNGLNYYIGQSTYKLGYDNASEGGVIIYGAAAPDLKWEVNTQKDIAVEFGLFKNRLKGSIEYYNRNTDGLIFDVPNSLSSGLDYRVENIGSMVNKGFEISLDGVILKTNDFSWSLNVNTSTIDNKITKLPQKEIIDGTKKLTVGHSIYEYWLRDWYGVDSRDGYALYVSDPNLIVAGDITQRVVNGVNVTTDQNKALYHYAGSAIPDLFGTFGTTFKYKGLQLDVMFSYQIGGKTYDSNYASLMHTGNNYGSALSTDILDRWQKPGDITDVPRLDVTRNTQSSSASDRWLMKSDYLSLRQINLSYKLPSDLISKLAIDNATLYMNGENLLLFTKRQGMDPTQTFNGTTQNRYIPSRVITLGFNLNF
ncbi:TonB-linked SusC/RagA family outer membrane protein [Flavobacterium sp. 90]|uniref:SusC/RagA family TonB-linked outer membrane protein n=1 Tax=unclassified Flavobacterium TaxID=196869 RepID=UPI000EADD98E|nr:MULTISPECIES: TonB-dependent receptor [unclassified Flavobacterium]RKR09153.1 TonB-linked SusC/RagA family outer membrane protein [Flavobacterium sp. 81]TCK52937.1 TonB-linked SusC/RagA family outer membrane protein [Flavobacterium sp. 90]